MHAAPQPHEADRRVIAAPSLAAPNAAGETGRTTPLARILASLATLAFPAVLGLFLLATIWRLDSLPLAQQDEPWIASVGWKFARHGVFGSDLFAGFYGMDRHYYEFMPVYPLLQAALFRVAGVGLWQARLVSVLLGTATLALTYALGRRLFGPATGVLAAAILLIAPVGAVTSQHLTGIPLVDAARVGRYDIAVPVFGLAALHVYLWAARRPRPRLALYAFSGVLAALAGLSHLYGAFWLVAVLALAYWDGAPASQMGVVLAGFAAPLLPYLAFVAAHPADWAGQVRLDAGRFELLSPGWYWSNLRLEYRRYAPGFGSLGLGALARVGFWSAVVLLPLAVIALLRAAVTRRERAARAVVLPLLLLAGALALFVQPKTSEYSLLFLPLAATAVAWFVVRVGRGGTRGKRAPLTRALLVLALAATATEGATSLVDHLLTPPATTYPALVARLQWDIPPGSRVLGIHTYWFGFAGDDYRSWFVPIVLTEPEYATSPVSIGAALSAVDPSVVIVDPSTRAYLDAHADVAAGAWAWLAERGFTLVDTFDDPSYGHFDVLRRDAQADAGR